MRVPTFNHVLALSAVIRVALVIYSEYHDAHSIVKYTDVDYRVFTDAARFILKSSEHRDGAGAAQGPLASVVGLGDPYLRDTYRYTPLLALIMTPNITLHPSFGKIIFSLCDIIVGIMLYELFCSVPPKPSAKAHVVEQQAVIWVSILWLLNPLVFTISTRGSSESILGLLVVGTLYLILRDHRHLAAVLFGISVHWKIYPIIYSASILAFYGAISDASRSKNWFLRLTNYHGLCFGVISASTFVVVTGALYLVWGYPLLWHSYLYHLGRIDHRHNFSSYFYATYLAYPSAHSEQLVSSALISHPLVSFLPQISLSLVSGFLLAESKSELPLTWFIQTMIFVTLNKVCTSQYFIWYIWFLPLVLPRLKLSIRDASLMVAIWVGSQAIWLSTAYRLEFLGEQVYLPLWLASMVFLAGNSWVLVKMLSGAYA
ncbi:GPI mannosyltransferase 1 [Hysterangium stoloniferum]|nr:GPI mannosyltransferase 1 [Hysterangium stoloniferum]